MYEDELLYQKREIKKKLNIWPLTSEDPLPVKKPNTSHKGFDSKSYNKEYFRTEPRHESSRNESTRSESSRREFSRNEQLRKERNELPYKEPARKEQSNRDLSSMEPLRSKSLTKNHEVYDNFDDFDESFEQKTTSKRQMHEFESLGDVDCVSPTPIEDKSHIPLKKPKQSMDLIQISDESESDEMEVDPNITLIAVLRILTAFEDYLGSLGPKIIDLLAKAVALEKVKPNLADDLLMNEENSILLDTCKEKLTGQIMAGILEERKMKGVKTAIKHVSAIVKNIDKKQKNASSASASLVNAPSALAPFSQTKSAELNPVITDKIINSDLFQKLVSTINLKELTASKPPVPVQSTVQSSTSTYAGNPSSQYSSAYGQPSMVGHLRNQDSYGNQSGMYPQPYQQEQKQQQQPYQQHLQQPQHHQQPQHYQQQHQYQQQQQHHQQPQQHYQHPQQHHQQPNFNHQSNNPNNFGEANFKRDFNNFEFGYGNQQKIQESQFPNYQQNQTVGQNNQQMPGGLNNMNNFPMPGNVGHSGNMNQRSTDGNGFSAAYYTGNRSSRGGNAGTGGGNSGFDAGNQAFGGGTSVSYDSGGKTSYGSGGNSGYGSGGNAGYGDGGSASFRGGSGAGGNASFGGARNTGQGAGNTGISRPGDGGNFARGQGGNNRRGGGGNKNRGGGGGNSGRKPQFGNRGRGGRN